MPQIYISPEEGDIFVISVNGTVYEYPTGQVLEVSEAEEEVIKHAVVPQEKRI